MSDSSSMHPGAVLSRLLIQYGLSQRQLALNIRISQQHISRIILKQCRMNASVALRLERAFPEYSARFWLDLQSAHDLYHEVNQAHHASIIRSIKQHSPICYSEQSE